MNKYKKIIKLHVNNILFLIKNIQIISYKF